MNGRSIQDIVPPARSKPLRPSVTPPPPPSQMPKPTPDHYNEPRKGTGMLFVWIAIGAVVIAGGTIALMSTVFHTARAEVTLLEWKSDVSGTYNAGGETTLTYQPVTVSDVATRTVPATGSVQAEDRATGTIVISNLYSTKTQRLITNTRFESAEGRVYRIHSPVTVPGYTTKNGQKVAGVLEVVVYADGAGETFNTPSAEFKLPGLKGSDQYTLITAKTKGPITGGFIGKRATIEKSVRDQAVADLRAELDRKLRDKIAGDAPSASVVFADSIAIRYFEDPDVATGSEATISIKGTAVAPAMNSDALARELATHAAIASDAPLTLVNAAEITYTVIEGTSIDSGGPISFTLSGTAHLTAVFNPLKYAEDLAGKSEEEAQAVRASYPALIGPMTIAVYPFWLGTLPTNPERISVSVTGALDQ